MSIAEKVSNSPGYSLDLEISKEELLSIKNFIYEQWLNRLLIEDSKTVKKITSDGLSIEHYHLIDKNIDHHKVWSKRSRILLPSFHDWILTTNFHNNLMDNFGIYVVSDEENLGWPNYYWRITRPMESKDIGPVHRDSWFWEINEHFQKPEYPFTRIKVWIAIFTEIGKNGLLIEPNSHRRKDIIWESVNKDGIKKPSLQNKSNDLMMKLINTKPGQVIIFNDNLLHGGSPNKGRNSRVSLEFTMLVKK